MEPSNLCEYFCLGVCELGLFGGRPYERNCRACMAAGENNTEYAAKLFKARETTHPPNRPPVSGCCDPVIP